MSRDPDDSRLAPPGPFHESCYVAARDGTRLAVFLFRPAESGRPVARPLPVVWTHNRYHAQGAAPERVRAWEEHLPWLNPAASQPPVSSVSLDDTPWLGELVDNGYVVAIVDARGSGASFGTRSGPLSPDEARDAYDLTEWFASQPWCDGAVGMFGRSYMGTNQMFAAAAPSPHLRAVFPEMALFDLYTFVYSGGVFRHDFARSWSRDVARRDREDPAVRVGGDPSGALLAEARAVHAFNRDTYGMFANLPHRDSTDLESGERSYDLRNPAYDGHALRTPKIPVYLLAGWYDPFVRDAFAWFVNTPGVRRLVVGPWAHTGNLGFDLAAEHLRWYDRWLKGAPDPIEDEAPLHFYVIGAPEGERWRAAWSWPLPEARPLDLYLCAGPTGTVRSCNDGLLGSAPPKGEAVDEYRVDYTATSGTASRWTNAYGGPFGYRDLLSNDEKGLTYTTGALEADLNVVGHPVAHVWVSSSAEDLDLFAFLEEVGPDGAVRYASEGVLRASHRALATPPFLLPGGVPFHRSGAGDVAPLPRHPVELVFDLHPIARRFPRGHRVRLTLTCADRDNALTPESPEPPLVRIHRGEQTPTRLVLPVVPG
ncbi:MAG: CocE/NonD family hydrolase [Myxococcota bacterium]